MWRIAEHYIFRARVSRTHCAKTVTTTAQWDACRGREPSPLAAVTSGPTTRAREGCTCHLRTSQGPAVTVVQAAARWPLVGAAHRRLHATAQHRPRGRHGAHQGKRLTPMICGVNDTERSARHGDRPRNRRQRARRPPRRYLSAPPVPAGPVRTAPGRSAQPSVTPRCRRFLCGGAPRHDPQELVEGFHSLSGRKRRQWPRNSEHLYIQPLAATHRATLTGPSTSPPGRHEVAWTSPPLVPHSHAGPQPGWQGQGVPSTCTASSRRAQRSVLVPPRRRDARREDAPPCRRLGAAEDTGCLIQRHRVDCPLGHIRMVPEATTVRHALRAAAAPRVGARGWHLA